jgi:energy-coupling factor transporter ATP-binding protein EcfA2
MSGWDDAIFQDHLGQSTSWGLFTGRNFSGKSTASAALSGMINSKIINFKQLRE